MKKFTFLTILLAAAYFIIMPSAQADSALNADFDILNDPGYGLHEAQYAPSTLRFAAYSYSYTDKSPTRFRFDCTSDGSYEIDQTVPADYAWGPSSSGDGYVINGGDYSYVVIPRSGGKDAWWGQTINKARIECYYPLPGNYTIKMIAERSGIEVFSTRSFNLNEPTVSMIVKPVYKNNIIDDGYPNSEFEQGKGGGGINNVPQSPAIVDFGVSIWNPSRFPLKPSSGIIKFDCDSNGTYEKTDSYPRPASNIGNFCNYFGSPDCLQNFGYQLSYYSEACTYDKPGIYKVKARAELNRVGAPPYVIETSTEFPVVSKNEATFQFTSGGKPTESVSLPKGLDLKLEVTNIVWTNASYDFDCGNGQSKSYAVNTDFTKRYYDADYSALLQDLCNYDNSSPGEYLVKVKAEFQTMNLPGGIDFIRNTLPLGGEGANILFLNNKFYRGGGGSFKITGLSGNYLTYMAEKEIKIIVTGDVFSPFRLRWDVDSNKIKPNSCSVKGPYISDANLSKKYSAKDEIKTDIEAPVETYNYTLTCDGLDGSPVEKTIKVNVVPR